MQEQNELPIGGNPATANLKLHLLARSRKIPRKQTRTRRPCRTRPCDNAKAANALAKLALNGIACFRSIVDEQFNKNMRAVCIAFVARG